MIKDKMKLAIPSVWAELVLWKPLVFDKSILLLLLQRGKERQRGQLSAARWQSYNLQKIIQMV